MDFQLPRHRKRRPVIDFLPLGSADLTAALFDQWPPAESGMHDLSLCHQVGHRRKADAISPAYLPAMVFHTTDKSRKAPDPPPAGNSPKERGPDPDSIQPQPPPRFKSPRIGPLDGYGFGSFTPPSGSIDAFQPFSDFHLPIMPQPLRTVKPFAQISRRTLSATASPNPGADPDVLDTPGRPHLKPPLSRPLTRGIPRARQLPVYPYLAHPPARLILYQTYPLAFRTSDK